MRFEGPMSKEIRRERDKNRKIEKRSEEKDLR